MGASQDAESEASVQQALDALVERGSGSTTVVLVAHRSVSVFLGPAVIFFKSAPDCSTVPRLMHGDAILKNTL